MKRGADILWRGADTGTATATLPISDGRRLDIAVTQLARPYAGCCEIMIDMHRGRDFIAQILAVKVRLTPGRAQQRAVKLATTLAPVL